MTSRDGFSSDMDPFALDVGTAERLITGWLLVADAPPEYRAVAGTLQALRDPPEEWELAGEPSAVERIAAAVVLERQVRSVQRSRRFSARLAGLAATAAVACGLPLTGALASAAALPEPAQDFASTVLDKVGISVPTSSQDPDDDGPPSTTGDPAPASTTGSSPGPSGPGPEGATSPPDLPSPAAPGKGQGDPNGAPGDGTPPNEPGQGGAHAPKNPSGGGNGKGHGR